MKLEEPKQLYRKAWENDYDSLQTDRFDEIGARRYSIRTCTMNFFVGAVPETKPF